MNKGLDKEIFRDLYRGFDMPLCEIDCGSKCGPYNDYGVPVCCDIHQVIPSAFELEWRYLRENTDLWKPWSSSTDLDDQELEEGILDGQVLLQCKGYRDCEREFRSLTCRAFPFYPYLDSTGGLRGLAYYPEFRFGCWILSNLDVVEQSFKEAFQWVFQRVFELYPYYRQNFIEYSEYERYKAAKENEMIVLLGFAGDVRLIDPVTEEDNPVQYSDLRAYGPFEITRELRFPGE